MTENDPRKRQQHPRRNPAFSPRPPPGVQKALHNFGVPDLRQLLDKKHQEQGQEQQSPNHKAKLPPPDPQYNYLKDPSREVTNETLLPTHEEHKKASEKRRQPPRQSQGPIWDQTGSNSNHHNNNVALKDRSASSVESKKNVTQNSEIRKKELRFSDTVTNLDEEPTKGKELHTSKQRQGSFRGRKSGGIQTKDVLENPINIKVKLSLETGQRSCELDENTVIPDIKHVPDQKPSRGGFRGSRGRFRGRGRGRGSFGSKQEHKKPTQNHETSQGKIAVDQGVDEGLPQGDHEEDEHVDSNENYEQFNIEDDGAGLEVEKPFQDPKSFKANLVESITITSSNFQDGEVQRDVLVNSVEQVKNESEKS